MMPDLELPTRPSFSGNTAVEDGISSDGVGSIQIEARFAPQTSNHWRLRHQGAARPSPIGSIIAKNAMVFRQFDALSNRLKHAIHE